MEKKQKVPIVAGLFTWTSDEPHLIASRCKKCGTVAFPKAAFCPNPDCEKVRENVEEIQLSNKAKLWTWTIQVYPPPEPFKMEPFQPYAIGMLDTEEGIRVLSMLTTTENLKLGMAMQMTTGKLYEDQENEYITWMWKPAD